MSALIEFRDVCKFYQMGEDVYKRQGQETAKAQEVAQQACHKGHAKAVARTQEHGAQHVHHVLHLSLIHI